MNEGMGNVGSGLIAKVMRFAAVSGVGLGLDICVFFVLTQIGVRAGLANVVSASLAVTYVYFVATRRVFAYEGRFLLPLFAAYVAYQLVAVPAASWAIDALVVMSLTPLAAKVLILPVTFSANFLMMAFLTRSSKAARAAEAAMPIAAAPKGAERVLLFIPMYNCAAQIPRVIAQLTPRVRALIDEVVVVNNRSTDDGEAVAAKALSGLDGLSARVLRNDDNYGLGGSHKVAFQHALAHGFDYCIVLHGDDQGDIADLAPLLEAGAHRGVDCLLGARFMAGSRLVGYSRLRTFGNHVFNLIYSAASGRRIFDLGSGLNIYSVKALANRTWLRHADDLTFNYHMILHSIAQGWRIAFFPLAWREDDQTSNVKLVAQSLRVLGIAWRYATARADYLAADYSSRPDHVYTSTQVFDRAGTLEMTTA
jgi:dolichol-phosphate mannosyltransferase